TEHTGRFLRLSAAPAGQLDGIVAADTFVTGVGDDESSLGSPGNPRRECAGARDFGIVGMGEDRQRPLGSPVEDHGAVAIALRTTSIAASSTSTCVINRIVFGAIVPANTPSLRRCARSAEVSSCVNTTQFVWHVAGS